MSNAPTAVSGDAAEVKPRIAHVILGFAAFMFPWLPVACVRFTTPLPTKPVLTATPLGATSWEAWPILIIGVALIASGLASYSPAVRRALQGALTTIHHSLCIFMIIICCFEIWRLIAQNGATPSMFISKIAGNPMVPASHVLVIPIMPVALLAGALLTFFKKLPVRVWAQPPAPAPDSAAWPSAR